MLIFIQNFAKFWLSHRNLIIRHYWENSWRDDSSSAFIYSAVQCETLYYIVPIKRRGGGDIIIGELN